MEEARKKEIIRLCTRLANAWAAQPYWRLGQLLANLVRFVDKDVFFVEDDELILYLEALTSYAPMQDETELDHALITVLSTLTADELDKMGAGEAIVKARRLLRIQGMAQKAETDSSPEEDAENEVQ